jgi:hypothetical protein
MGWKYVMIENKLAAYPIIFPDKLVHLEIATVCRLIVPEVDRWAPRPVSAGMIESLYVEGVGGESETLRMTSRHDDETIINRYKYFHGIK